MHSFLQQPSTTSRYGHGKIPNQGKKPESNEHSDHCHTADQKQAPASGVGVGSELSGGFHCTCQGPVTTFGIEATSDKRCLPAGIFW
jgi:hypothetical protein